MDASTALVLLSCVQVFTIVLRLVAKKSFAAWLLALGTVPVAVQSAIYVARATQHAPADTAIAIIEVAVVALALVSLWRPASFCFWVGWVLNLALLGFLVYLEFFWHIFS